MVSEKGRDRELKVMDCLLDEEVDEKVSSLEASSFLVLFLSFVLFD